MSGFGEQCCLLMSVFGYAKIYMGLKKSCSSLLFAFWRAGD